MVHDLLHREGLGRYYELAGGVSPPAAPASAEAPRAWLGPLVERAEASPGGLSTLELDVQGLHCTACVWLLRETFRRTEGAVDVTVNSALGRVSLTWRRGAPVPQTWVPAVEAFGYRLGPARKAPAKASLELPLRLGISAALAVNVMLFSVSFHFGLTGADAQVHRLFTWLSLGLSTGTVVVGGWPFFRSAWQSLRRGVLHLDLPVAVGIGLVYALSLVQVRGGQGELVYFDTLNIFITLMLAGRLLQSRLVERNRRYLLEDDGADAFCVQRLVGTQLEPITAPQVQAGDVLVVAPGELVPVDAQLLDAQATLALDWVTGESEAVHAATGEVVAAGSFNAGTSALHAVAATDFADSRLTSLLRQGDSSRQNAVAHRQLFDRLARGWVVAVLVIAAVGFALWLPSGLGTAVNVAAALLVVTCPCAIGIAIPLAYELTQGALRRDGFFVRSVDLLDRLVRVRTVLFDKTGTLTLGRLELSQPSVVDGFSAEVRDAAFTLASRSAHPVSRCVATALRTRGARYDASAQTLEVPGQGVEWRRADGLYRLGRRAWAGAAPGDGAVLTRDGAVLAELATREVPRLDARREVETLTQRGLSVWLVSGDARARAEAMAARLGIAPERVLSEQTPEAKAEAVRRIDRQDTLFLGDGVNDAQAFDAAFAAGTPAVDRPVMPGRSDFFLVGEALSAVSRALTRAARLRATVLWLVGLSVAYNAFAVSLCLSGRMSPLVAAVSMPLSTAALLLLTAASLRERRPAAPTRSMTSLKEVPV